MIIVRLTFYVTLVISSGIVLGKEENVLFSWFIFDLRKLLKRDRQIQILYFI